MRARALLVNRHLGAGETDLGVKEVRVITEAAIAARCRSPAVPAPLGDDRFQVVPAHDEREDCRNGRRDPPHRVNQPSVSRCYRHRFSAIQRSTRSSRRDCHRARARRCRNRPPAPANPCAAPHCAPLVARFSRKVQCGSGASGTLKALCGSTSIPSGASSRLELLELFWLPVAMTSFCRFISRRSGIGRLVVTAGIARPTNHFAINRMPQLVKPMQSPRSAPPSTASAHRLPAPAAHPFRRG